MAVEVKDLVKKYKNFAAVRGISFEIREGEIFGLIGPNGAGKTTTLRIIATLLKPTSGNVKVFGYDVIKESEKVRELISYLPEEAGAYKDMTGMEYLKFMAEVYGIDDQDAIKRALEIADLGPDIYSKIGTYSKGMVRKLLLARTLMTRPKFAILDEPTSGLDVINAVRIRNIIKNERDLGTTFLISSHNMLEVAYLCDRVAIIHKGRIFEIGSPEDLMKKYDANNLEEVFQKVVRSFEE
ncbi:MAG: multidrug ABC transporter ATP-binding protein [Thermoplasmata archaeon]|nr:ABC transporter ATP-binding protein [Euryarchaeota archaeon]RLF66630.1 MAG: multidrug ABC transporter ATP-binding protein [Thermoplasmata archaeon]